MAHIGKERRLGLAGVLRLLPRQAKLLLALLQRRDVGIEQNGVVFLGAPFAHQDPAAIPKLENRLADAQAMLIHAPAQKFALIGMSVGKGMVPDRGLAELLERLAGHDELFYRRKKRPIDAVRQYQTIVAVIECECRRRALERAQQTRLRGLPRAGLAFRSEEHT